MENIKIYDFKKSEKFSLENMKILTLSCEEFCKSSNLQIAYELKNETLDLQMGETEQINYENLLEKVSHDSIIVEYDNKPLINNLIIMLDKYVALSIVDMILGGDGQVADLNRNLTSIDLEMIHYLLESLLARNQVISENKEIKIQEIYTDIAQYRKLKGKDSLFIATINVSLYDKEIGVIRIGIPYSSMEPVINQLSYNSIQNNNIDRESGYDLYESKSYKYIKDIKIDVSAILGSANIKIRELLKLEEGDIVLLNEKINENIDVCVGGFKSYKAKPGLIGIKKAIEIIDIVNGEK